MRFSHGYGVVRSIKWWFDRLAEGNPYAWIFVGVTVAIVVSVKLYWRRWDLKRQQVLVQQEKLTGITDDRVVRRDNND